MSSIFGLFLATKVANVEMVHIRVANFLDLSPKLKQNATQGHRHSIIEMLIVNSFLRP